MSARVGDMTLPVDAACEVVARRRDGAYWTLTLAAAQIARRARPGQFVSIRTDAPDALLRRPFSIARVSHQGAAAGTIDIVFDAHGPGTHWLARVRPHEMLHVLGPLGNGFPLPQRRVSCLLVGGGYGVAPLLHLASELADRGLRVDLIAGAASAERLLSPVEAKGLTVSATFTTEDGSYGHRGRVTDVLEDVAIAARSGVVYACGPNPMLRAVSEQCGRLGLPVQVSVEELMACGTGVCFTCVFPMRTRDGSIRMRRTCVDGPVLNGSRIAWEMTRFETGQAPDVDDDEVDA